jgi:thioredoxin
MCNNDSTSMLSRHEMLRHFGAGPAMLTFCGALLLAVPLRAQDAAKTNKPKPVPITEKNYDGEVIKSKTPVLLFFSAAWAGPSKAVTPIIQQLTKEYAGKVKVGEVDADTQPKLWEKLNVQGVPAYLFILNGKEVARTSGIPQDGAESLRSAISKHLGV